MILRRVTAAAGRPVMLVEAKAHLRLDGNLTGSEDAAVLPYLDSAIAWVGEAAGRVMAQEVWKVSEARISGDYVLPKSPVSQVSSIKYFDMNDAEQTATLADFYVFLDDDRTIVRPKAGKSWPSPIDRPDGITITFSVGYAELPAPLKNAVLMMTHHFHEDSRGAVAMDGQPRQIPLAVEEMIAPYRLGWAAG